MSFNLQAILPQLLPKAIAWAEARASEIAQDGIALNDVSITIARKVGVISPGKIRVALVQQLPLPDDPELRKAALQTGLLGPGMIGLTLGCGIYICRGYESTRLLSHECRHVHQYEKAGSITAFLPLYLQQIVEFGYNNAPFEVDARAHELDHA